MENLVDVAIVGAAGSSQGWPVGHCPRGPRPRWREDEHGLAIRWSRLAGYVCFFFNSPVWLEDSL